MESRVLEGLDTVIRNWNAMAQSDHEEAESTADRFEASFYAFIDELRDWVHALEQRPPTVEALLALPLLRTILDRLPVPLHLNLETEADLMLDDQIRIQEEKYD